MNQTTPVTVPSLQAMKAAGENIAILTAYDAAFASALEAGGVDALMVGDSLGMVVQGQDSTLPVSMRDMIYHTRNVRRGSKRSLIISDLPFMSYTHPAQALKNAARLMKDGGAHMVKLEGGAAVVSIVEELSCHGIPVCGHLGLLPQSVHKIGGYKVQGRSPEAAETILTDAKALEAAGAELLVLECIPADLAARITAALTIPTIGIGAGAACDGQVLVVYDMLGITPGKRPRFSKDFLAALSGDADISPGITAAVQAYVAAVKAGTFPAEEHIFR